VRTASRASKTLIYQKSLLPHSLKKTGINGQMSIIKYVGGAAQRVIRDTEKQFDA
jgi:hypothetical protein